MSLYTLSIRRPVLAVVMATVIVLFGLIGFSRLGVREFPSVDPPVITVSTEYRGANTDVIESQITEPLESAINAVDGIRTLTSTSRDGRSTIQAEFDLGIDLLCGTIVTDPDAVDPGAAAFLPNPVLTIDLPDLTSTPSGKANRSRSARARSSRTSFPERSDALVMTAIEDRTPTKRPSRM